MDIFSTENQALALQVVAALTVALPILEKIAEHTHNKWDNAAVKFLKDALAFIPRIRLGK